MSHPDQHTRSDGHRYAIRVEGHLHPRWAETFDGMNLTRLDDGTTLLDGVITDQAELHGLLRTVRDLGLPLISLNRLDSTESPLPEAIDPSGA